MEKIFTNLALWILKKCNPEIYKNIEILQNYSIKKIIKSVYVSNQEIIYSQIPDILIRQKQQNLIEGLVEEIIAQKGIKIERSDDMMTKEINYAAISTILIPKR